MPDNNLRDELKALGYDKDAADELASHIEGNSPASAAVGCYVERHDIPELPQRQDSTQAQLRDLRMVAERLGMYDAADLLRTHEDQHST